MTIRDMLTEDEAKTKWCPLVRVSQGPSRQFNDENNPTLACVGSVCMFWRWSQQDNMGTPTGFCGGAIAPKYI